jgi:hypothetical protein
MEGNERYLDLLTAKHLIGDRLGAGATIALTLRRQPSSHAARA